MEKEISNDLVGKWLKGWSLSRNLPLPTAYRSGFIVEVNDEREKSRYVFSELNADFLHLAKTTSEPRDLAILFLDETLTWKTAVGAVLIIAGTLFLISK